MRDIITSLKAKVQLIQFTATVQSVVFKSSNLTEMMPVEWQRCLRSQLEKVELCGKNLLSSRNCGQVEAVFHLFTAHCNRKRIIREQKNTTCHFLQKLQATLRTDVILRLSKKLRTVFPSRRYGSLVTPSTSATVLYRSSMY